MRCWKKWLMLAVSVSSMLGTNGLVPFCVAQDAPAEQEAPAEQDPKKDPQVELLDAGNEPRQELRFRPTKGSVQKVTFIMQMDMTTSVNGQAIPGAKLPSQKFTLETTVRDVSPEGDVTMDFKYTDVGLIDDPANSSPVAELIEKNLKPLIGASGTAVVTSRGITKSNQFNVPEKMDPLIKATLDSMKDSLNRLSSPLPAEAVGVGGKWKVTQEMSVSGMTLVQEATHEVEQLDAQGATMKVDMTQRADAQEMKAPGLPAGAKMSLESLETTGLGHSSISLASVLPLKMDMKVDSNMKMKMSLGGLEQKLDVKSATSMTMEP